MFSKKSFGIAFACALALGASGAAFATPMNLAGVFIDPSSGFDLNVSAVNFREGIVSSKGDVLTGYGLVSSINNTYQPEFCPSCNLTFTFSYTVKDVDTTGASPKIVFDGGTINFFVDHTSSFGDGSDPTKANIGTPWLTLTGHDTTATGFATSGQLFSTIVGTTTNPGFGSNGAGFLDATGGPMKDFFDTNSIDSGSGGFTDFGFNSSFLTQVFGGCTPSADPTSICFYPIQGTAFLKGDTKVPEPSALGLMGLGLAALGFMVGRRRKQAEGRV